VLIIPSSWGSQLDGEITSTPCRIKLIFLAPLPGKKKTSARGVLHAHPLLCFKFFFTLFLLASFYQKYKKLVPTIVVIFVGLLLSCFIMLSINGWFL
jgi:hypothetical protein